MIQSIVEALQAAVERKGGSEMASPRRKSKCTTQARKLVERILKAEEAYPLNGSTIIGRIWDQFKVKVAPWSCLRVLKEEGKVVWVPASGSHPAGYR